MRIRYGAKEITALGPFCLGIFVVRFVVPFIVPQIVPQIVQKPPQKRGTISEVFDTILWYDLRTPPPIGVDYRENIQFQEMDSRPLENTPPGARRFWRQRGGRSEEHTSELQSQ